MERCDLSAEDERVVFERWKAGCQRRAHAQLVRSQQGMIAFWARRYRSTECSLADLVPEGNVGLLYAMERFDPARGVRLATFASWWVRAHMLRYVERNSRIVRGATTAARRRLFYQLAKTTASLSRDGSLPASEEIAEALGVSTRDVEAMATLRTPAASLDGSVYDDELTRMERVSDPSPSPEDEVAGVELGQRLSVALEDYAASLEGAALALFRERIASTSPAPLCEIGARWGLSNAAVRRLEKKVATPLRRHLYRRMGDAVVETLGGC